MLLLPCHGGIFWPWNVRCDACVADETDGAMGYALEGEFPQQMAGLFENPVAPE